MRGRARGIRASPGRRDGEVEMVLTDGRDRLTKLEERVAALGRYL